MQVQLCRQEWNIYVFVYVLCLLYGLLVDLEVDKGPR